MFFFPLSLLSLVKTKLNMYSVILSTLFLALFFDSTFALIDSLYCGQHDCYSVLGVTRDASKTDIGKVYRQLAKKYHPDMHKSPDSKKKAAEKFTLIATAYEILKDDDSRKDYDYMLDNPDKVYGHYYRYYRRQMAPKVDARIVIVVTITVISVLQYLGAWSRYKSAINHLITVPKYRLKALEIAKQEKLLEMNKKRDRRSKDQIKEEAEAVLKKILEEKIDIRWFWKFVILKHEYGEEEKLFLIRKHLQCSLTQWDAIPEEEKEECLESKLWIKDNFVKWKQKKEEDMKTKLAESARYKSYRRYMKNHGPGQITLDD
ncbi:dnaJ homolog subfamily C member 25 homolog isoform X2 [Stegodyphus dumicola]|uniref:dnaJ homolog subfamily C member 25 homolog isoform X2 n=1 Tax=Stegodyphus dumicola TaxID=202533 RepID=UPI0015AFD3C6|nr:dnaJ homolog subfamily C member 25 homolog isoform X2 [Stegodyphus dumicola]